MDIKQRNATENTGSTPVTDTRNFHAVLPLRRMNFIGMACAGIMIITGFLLMLGGSSSPETFNADIFSTRRIVVGPAITFIGFVAMAISIIIDPARLNRKN